MPRAFRGKLFPEAAPVVPPARAAGGTRPSPPLATLRLMASLAAYPGMMRRDRERLGLRECRAAWLLGLTVREYRALEAGDGDGHVRSVGPDGRGVPVAEIARRQPGGRCANCTPVLTWEVAAPRPDRLGSLPSLGNPQGPPGRERPSRRPFAGKGALNRAGAKGPAPGP